MSTSSNSVKSSDTRPRTASGHTAGLIQLVGAGRIADAYGAEVAELYLDEFHQRIDSFARSGDRVIRVDASRYAIILRDVTVRHHVQLAAAKLLRVFEQSTEIIGERLGFDVHAGFAIPDDSNLTLKALTAQAESALRRAIAEDQPYLIITPLEATATREDPSLVPRLEQALERGEFQLHYQPKVNASYRNVVGAEGLVRWHDSIKRKIIPPGMFIEAAEKAKIIKPMTIALLRSAVLQCSTWDDSVGVSVNVPPPLFKTSAITQAVEDALEFHSLPAQKLTLEITERGEMPQTFLQQLSDLRALGVKISIDDFGTGQCSLSYFRDLPADEIKIDQSFVRAMLASKKDLAIVHGIIDLAHHCDMTTVAEGVEDKATADLLTDMQCDVLQGYFFGRPVSLEEFKEEHLHGLGRRGSEDLFAALLDD
jgi:EAL domain-containing protein (putative c-di-GMP-specific phosphodiesterase class I)/GGDEF domain-containing protein